jgi:hypothetical protein
LKPTATAANTTVAATRAASKPTAPPILKSTTVTAEETSIPTVTATTATAPITLKLTATIIAAAKILSTMQTPVPYQKHHR